MTRTDSQSSSAENVPPREQPLRDRVLLFVGSLAYLGYVPVASGTVAVAVVAVPAALLILVVAKLSVPSYVVLVAAFTLVSIWIAGESDRVLNEKDSSKNVIDELPGYWIALVGLPLTWPVIVLAFFIERAIDIVKIWPATWIERRLPGGWGVVLDDVVAGLYTLAILHALNWWRPEWLAAMPV
jgi:phosphatidylglycerophosphatase A